MIYLFTESLTRMLSKVALVYHPALVYLPLFLLYQSTTSLHRSSTRTKAWSKMACYNSDSRGRKYCGLLKHFHNKSAYFKLKISVR